jgi:molybdate transport system substrate-binding protein
VRRAAWVALAALAIALPLAGCGRGAGAQTSITVSAAASLTDAFTAVASAYEQAHAGTRVRLNFGASSALAAQITQGAPVDVFASANEQQMQVVAQAGLATHPQDFAANAIVIAVPHGDTKVRSFADLAKPGIRLVLAGAEVPAGVYARAAFQAADTAGAFGAHFEQRVLKNLASEEADVRAVLTKVELGEADAGVVYATDAAVAGAKVDVVPVPATYASPARYPIAAIGKDGGSAAARDFVAFVESAPAQQILARYGFAPPAGS